MDEKKCALVIFGADKCGYKEVIGLIDGSRESTQSRRKLLLDLKHRGLTQPPELAIANGTLWIWGALREVCGTTDEQRCWFLKTMTAFDAMPKSLRERAKGRIHDIQPQD